MRACRITYRTTTVRRVFSGWVAAAFLLNTVVLPLPGHAQGLPQTILNLPAPGTMVTPSAAFSPALVTGMTLYPDNPLRFDFIIDIGDDKLQGEALEWESQKLIHYFMAALTVPEDELWVNLSPYEKDRIIPSGLSQTEMGRDMLAQDYLLKQLTASLMYPEDAPGKEFWERVYAKAQAQFGTTEIPVDTFNKVWIVPEKAVVYVHGNSVFVAESHLKVMLEEDYLALESNAGRATHGLGNVTPEDLEPLSGISAQIIREVLLPAIEQEINAGKNFANLRQIYHSLILAAWYKKNLKEGLLRKIYLSRNKTNGIALEDKAIKDKIYAQYLDAFKRGVYNYIKEDYDPATRATIPRKYFSGGLKGVAQVTEEKQQVPAALAAVAQRPHTTAEVKLEKIVNSPAAVSSPMSLEAELKRLIDRFKFKVNRVELPSDAWKEFQEILDWNERHRDQSFRAPSMVREAEDYYGEKYRDWVKSELDRGLGDTALRAFEGMLTWQKDHKTMLTYKAVDEVKDYYAEKYRNWIKQTLDRGSQNTAMHIFAQMYDWQMYYGNPSTQAKVEQARILFGSSGSGSQERKRQEDFGDNNRSKAASRNPDPLKYYFTLGVAPGATDETIKAAWRKKAKATHPDIPGNESREQEFKDANAAWEVLGDPQKRRDYDRKSQSSSPVKSEEQKNDYGGIDLNSANLDLQQKGSAIEFELPVIGPDFDPNSVEGLRPIIIHITPVTNFPLLLGLASQADMIAYQ